MTVLGQLIVEHFAPSTVLDVGCGEGFLTAWLARNGIEAWGLDGDDLDGVDEVVDLTDPPDLGRWDVAVSLEVGEHLPGHAADRFVAALCQSAPVVLFSAAIPAQGGPGHVNEQWPSYWVELFARHGHTHASGALRWQIWNDDDVESWYRQNLLVFSSAPLTLPEDGCPAVVHPGIWSVYQ
jgi:SAM-dependent methyltransferase